MANPVRYITCLILTILSILCIVYYFNCTTWDNFTFKFSFFVMSASILFTLYMFFYDLKKKKSTQSIGEFGDQIINDERYNFMLDTYSKFLFPFMFALILFEILLAFQSNFKIFQNATFLSVVVELYMNLCLPIFCFVDLLTTKRRRNPVPAKDILIILIICLAHGAYKIITDLILRQKPETIFPNLADYISLCLISVNGYILYDYITFKTSGEKEFILFKGEVIRVEVEGDKEKDLLGS